MKFLTCVVLVFTFGGCADPALQPVSPDQQAVDTVLSTLHRTAAEADWDTYFGLFTQDAVFMGTDASERWSIAQFQGYADASSGWSYRMTERHIHFSSDGRTAWFDEMLENANYGLTRGTGVLRLQADEWRFAQYNLSIPIPNDLARDVVEQIRALPE